MVYDPITMKATRIHITLTILIYASALNAQTVGNWNFNNVLTGTGTANNTVGSAVLGSGITTGAFNGGTVYFGEGLWPAGAINLTDYLEFSLTPNIGRLLNITVLTMEIRRSTTGTPVGSGPNNWSLRSSLDGFATDITSGVLTTNSVPATTVTLPVSFLNLSSTVTFRLYGYNATVTSGGLDRFVYDNITATGSIILPTLIEGFHARQLSNEAVQLGWTLNGDEPLTSIAVEKSFNGSDFNIIKNILPVDNVASQQYGFVDESGAAGNANTWYRIKLINATATVSYSAIQQVSFETINTFSVRPLPVSKGSTLTVRVQADKSANYRFSLYNMNGTMLKTTLTALTDGSQLVNLGNAPSQSGLYILIAEKDGTKISSKVWIN
jgi:hypothetical protein